MAEEHVCPVWVGYLLASPIRKLFQNPEKLLRPYINEGMTVLDIGCAMGFFSLPMGKMVGPEGKVVCVDLQEKMIESLKKRIRKTGLSDRIETRVCRPDSLNLDDYAGRVDFALASAVVHEVTDVSALFSELSKLIKPEGKVFVAEPGSHVSDKNFRDTVSTAEQHGFKVVDRPEVKKTFSVLLQKI